MKKSGASRRFQVSAQIHVETTRDITADSMEDALAQARKFDVLDFVELSGEHNDSSHEIVCLYEIGKRVS
jgi:hypothetical protein